MFLVNSNIAFNILLLKHQNYYTPCRIRSYINIVKTSWTVVFCVRDNGYKYACGEFSKVNLRWGGWYQVMSSFGFLAPTTQQAYKQQAAPLKQRVSIQFLASKYHSPQKGSKALERNGWFWLWGRGHSNYFWGALYVPVSLGILNMKGVMSRV